MFSDPGLLPISCRSPGAAEPYKTFLAFKKKGAGDPLAADAAKRLAASK
jgi:hypothetical protein